MVPGGGRTRRTRQGGTAARPGHGNGCHRPGGGPQTSHRHGDRRRLLGGAAAAGQARGRRGALAARDAASLPFESEFFDGITEGYLLRNVEDLEEVLREQHRVLKPGGRLVALETCPPSGLVEPVMQWGMRVIVPLLGQLVARDRSSYGYLESSTRAFESPQSIAGALRGLGFKDIGWRKKFFGTNVILWATKAN